MKITIIAASLFFLALPAHAQTHVAGGGGGSAAPGQLSYAGGGGGGGGFGSSSLAFTMPVINRGQEHYTYIYVQGSEQTFVPTRFVSFDAAVKLGKAALAQRPKTIVEVAAECRAAKKQAK